MNKIIVLMSDGCLDFNVMKPILLGMNRGGKFKFEFYSVKNDDGKKMKEKFSEWMDETGKPDAVPMFVDEKKKKAFYAPNIEKLLGWLEGPNWWKS